MNAQLCYFGGSGGFFALWHILLGTDYSCVIERNDRSYNNIRGLDWPTLQDIPASIDDFPVEIQQEIIDGDNQELIKKIIENKNGSPRSVDSIFYKKHWNINKDRTKWKSTEKWPENDLTQNSSFNNKLFFNCNPSREDILEDCDKKILLYTNYEIQTMLARNKNAWIYIDKNHNKVKKQKTLKFNGLEVYHEVAEIAKYTDYEVKLQDIVKTQGQALLDIFNMTINENNIYHNNMWLNLHTNEEKGNLIG